MFAAIREAYDIPRDDKLKLRDFPDPGARHPVRVRPAAGSGSGRCAVGQLAAAAPAGPRRAAACERDTGDAVKERVLAIVAEKTGYPPDMLDLDLDLEADLGIDTVKQAEMFAAIREAYDIPRDDKLKLRDFPTLAHVIQFVHDRRPDRDASRDCRPQRRATASRAVTGTCRASMDAANRVPRRVPVPVLRPPLDLCKPTGVTLGAGSRVLVMPDQGGVAKALRRSGSRSWASRRWCSIRPPDAEALAERIDSWLARRPGARRLLAAGARSPSVTSATMDLAALARGAARPREAPLRHDARRSTSTMAQPGTFLVAATRLGGQHGYDEAGAVAPLGGAVAGFAKAYKRERDRGAREGGRLRAEPQGRRGRRRCWSTRPCAIPARSRSATRRAALDASACRSSRRPTASPAWRSAATASSSSPAPRAASSRPSSPTWRPHPAAPSTCSTWCRSPIRRTRTCSASSRDREGLKRDLFERIKARGERATPALVERELAALERAQAALARDRGRARRRRHGALPQRRSDATPTPWRASSTRCAQTAAASTCCCTPPASRSAASCPTRSRASSTSSSTSRATAGSTCCTPSATCRSAPRSSSARSPAASATAARPTTAPPTTCSASASRASARRGPATRGIADRLDGVGRHRHGGARLDPEDDGSWPASTCCRPRPAFRSCAAS